MWHFTYDRAMFRSFLLFAALACAAACSPSGQTAHSAAASPTAGVAPADIDFPSEAEAWVRAQYPGKGFLLYLSGKADLDGDGVDEMLVYVGGASVCGSGGCPLAVLKEEGDHWRTVTLLSVVQLPVGVLDSRSHGWRDLWVTVAGGGVPAGFRRLQFDGTCYPANPTVSPAQPIDKPTSEVIAATPLTRIK